MAYYAALISVVQLLDDIILHDQYSTLSISKQEILKSLHEKFGLLEGSLQDYSSKGDDELTDHIERRIRDAALQAQDIIEIEISNQIRLENGSHDVNEDISHQLGLVDWYEKYVTKDTVKNYVEHLRIVQREIDFILGEITSIKEKQRKIEGSKGNCDLRDIVGDSKQAPGGSDALVGIGMDLTVIKGQLCGQSSQLQVISIVGMGGIGKTTLARNTFDDALVVYHFHCRAWVTVSQDYHAGTVLKSIIKSLDLTIDESLEWDEEKLKERIYKYLKGKRYLIAIDDVWTKEVWDDLNLIFPNDCNGSRVMLTTRLLDVAHYVGTSGFLHEMQLLNDDQSWNLFRQKVFAQEHCPSELEHIGKSIASKCFGLPLALVVVAGLLSNVRAPLNWQRIAMEVSAILSKTDGEISGILSLSYNHLPHQLKACFLYMGIFPEDYQVNISKLIQLWIAEGLLKSISEFKSLEKVGQECLEDLVKRNLVIITKRRSNGQFKFCILHDLLRDFCRQRAFNEGFFHDMHGEGYLRPRMPENVRRVNVISIDCFRHGSSNIGKLVRSLIFCLKRMEWAYFYGDEFDSCKLLRVLILPHTDVQSTPIGGVSQMVHLKYLSLSLFNPYFFMSLSELQNLQTININTARKGRTIILPREIWKMTQLRHLIIMPDMLLPLLPTVDDGTLVQEIRYLQTLMIVQEFTFTDQAIVMIPNLRKLKLRCGRNEPWSFYCLYNLVCLHQLEELIITFYISSSLPFVNFPHSFAFPQNLKKLSLQGCLLPWEDLTVVGSLPNLEVLRLRQKSLVGEDWDPAEDEFCRLKFLLLESLNLKHWQADNTHFPRLEHLKIRRCDDLVEIPLEIGEIPTLKFIDLYESPRAENSANLIQEEQRDLGNDVLQVRVGKL